MGQRDRSASDTIRAIYDAVLEPERWPEAFASLGRQVRGDHVIFFTQDMNANRTRFATGIGVGPQFFGRLRCAAEAGIVPAALFAIPDAKARTVAGIWSDGSFYNGDFYNNVVREDGGYAGLLAVPFRQDGNVGLLAIERLRNAPDYERDDASSLELVLPHLSNAMRIRLKLEDAEAHARQTYGAFDLLEFGVIVVDARARPVFLNRSAERIVRQGDGFWIGKDGLATLRQEETLALRRMVSASVDRACRRRGTEHDPASAAPYAARLRLPRLSGAPAWVATVIPLSPESSERLIGPQARAVIFLVQPTQQLPVDADAVGLAFGLTQRQSALAILIARGASLTQAAKALSISAETARSHLKEIFARTNTRRQVDLVRALSIAFASLVPTEKLE